MTTRSTLTDPAAYHQACQRGVGWCLELQRSDGSIRMVEPCFDSIYKFPAAYLVTGHYLEAAKVLNWLENDTLTEAGDFTFGERKHIFDWFHKFYTYTNSWITLAAQRAGFLRLARRGADYLLRYQNPDTGALQSAAIEQPGHHLADTTITSQGGICYLYTGRIYEAVRAAEAICRIIDLQEPGDAKLYYRLTADNHLARETIGDEPANYYYVDSTQATGQLYFTIGIPAAFLCHVYELTRTERYLHAARRYIDFALQCEGVLTSFASGKIGYALSLLYRSTGEVRYFDPAVHYLDWLTQVQKPDGRWMRDDWEDQHWYFTYDCTAEFVYWTSEMVRLLSSPRPPGNIAPGKVRK